MGWMLMLDRVCCIIFVCGFELGVFVICVLGERGLRTIYIYPMQLNP